MVPEGNTKRRPPPPSSAVTSTAGSPRASTPSHAPVTSSSSDALDPDVDGAAAADVETPNRVVGQVVGGGDGLAGGDHARAASATAGSRHPPESAHS